MEFSSYKFNIIDILRDKIHNYKHFDIYQFIETNSLVDSAFRLHIVMVLFNIWSSDMFLAYSSNLGAFAELVKDGTKNHVQQTQLQVQAIQSQMQLQNQTGVRQPHQVSQHSLLFPLYTEYLKVLE